MSEKMTQKEIIAQLRIAKTAHIQWRAYAQALVSGFSIDQNLVPVIHTNCKFGQWYYGQGQILANLKNYSAIDKPHAMLHQVYMEIYKVMYSKSKKGILGGMFNSKEKQHAKNEKKAQELMLNLTVISEELLAAINQLKQEVMHMSDEELGALY